MQQLKIRQKAGVRTLPRKQVYLENNLCVKSILKKRLLPDGFHQVSYKQILAEQTLSFIRW